MADELFAANDFIFLHNGDMLRTHPSTQCEGNVCVIHNPSQHALSTAPLHWRADRYLMERVCAHGIGHPDPDDLAHKRQWLTEEVYNRNAFGVHGCDGCCRPAATENKE